jgi:hypothetical protein
MNHSLRKHRKYAASAAHRWMHCTASIPLAEGLPETPSGIAAREGTFAHEILEHCLKNRERDAAGAMQAAAFYGIVVGTWENDDWYEPAIEGVQIALDYIYAILDAYPDARLLTEQEVYHVSAGFAADAGGTLDCAIIIPCLGIHYFLDYKHGFDPVSPVGNDQLKTYMECFASMYGYEGTAGFVGTIIQPRAFGEKISEHFYPIEEILMHGRAIDFIISEIEAGRTKFEATERTCKYCPARVTCPEQEKLLLAATQGTFASVQMVSARTLPAPTTLPLDRIAYVLAASEILTDWFTEIKSIAYEYARQGYHIPGYKLVEARARREWDGHKQTVLQQLSVLTGCEVEQLIETDIIGIGDATKLVKAHYKKLYPNLKAKELGEAVNDALAPLTFKNSSGNLTLVPVTDSRQAVVDQNRTANDFSSVSVIPTE